MDSEQEKTGASGPPDEEGLTPQSVSADSQGGDAAPASIGTGAPASTASDYDDPYGEHAEPAPQLPAVASKTETPPPAPLVKQASPPPPPKPPSKDEDEEDSDDDGMLRMSFMQHLEELRSRVIKALIGIGVAFFVCLIFANDLWRVVSEPAVEALTELGYENTKLAQIKPMEAFSTVWVKVPILASIFLASPWVLFQVWAFVAPGLYRRERRWAVPFVVTSAGLFITGGLFAYFVAFRFGLTFLLGIGRDINIAPVVSITEYFDLFVNVTLGIGLVFELPVLIFFLVLLRIVTPGFLVRNSRYAVLIIVILAAIVTPTPDVVNLMLFSVPMCLLYFVGAFAGYLLMLHRENKRFPWLALSIIILVIAGAAAGAIYLAVTWYGYHLEQAWPFLTR